MLFRKTFRNAVAALLGLALALATGTAHAVINLDATGTLADPDGTVTFSSETFAASGSSFVQGSETYYRIYPTTTPANLRIEGTLGVRGAAGRQVFVRYDLTNMRFWGAVTTTGSGGVAIPDANGAATGSIAAADITVEAGGARGNDFVIVSWPEDAVIASDAVVVAMFHNNMALRAGAPGSISQSTYLTLSNAIAGNQSLATKSKTVATMAQSLGTSVTPRVVTATVASSFNQLAGSGANTIGSLSVRVGPVAGTHLHATTGAAVNTLAQVATAGNVAAGTGSLVTFSGDFSVGAFSANTASPAACGATALATRNAQREVLESVSIPAAVGTTSFCIGVAANNTTAIPSGSYTVAVDYAGISNAAFPPADIAAQTIGRIRRDGTQVQIPYLTTFSGYTQRVVIVNRNRTPVTYAFTFTPEDGTTAAEGAMATGTVGAMETVSIRAGDIVTLTGRTRTAATLDVVATSGSVDVATTQVNMDTQGTDTVIYESLSN